MTGSIVALLIAAGRPSHAGIVSAVAVATVLVKRRWPSVYFRLEGTFARTAQMLAEAVGSIVSMIVWLVFILPQWLVTGLVRQSLLVNFSAKPSSAWCKTSTTFARDVTAHERQFSIEESTGRLLFGPRLLVRATFGLAMIILPILGSTCVIRTNNATERHDTQTVKIAGLAITSYAHRREPWFNDYAAELSKPMNLWDPYLGTELRNIEGRYLNINDGRRASFQPPNPTIDVWYFGGSTMFGLGQRDHGTIPSVIARLALRDGIRIRSVNFGVSAFVNWQETELLSRALSSQDPPDLIIFYDGVNELALAHQRSLIGDNDEYAFRRQLLDPREEYLFKRDRGLLERSDRFTDYLRIAARQYGRGVEIARRLGGSYQTQVIHFWQPIFDSKQPQSFDAPLVKRLDLTNESASTRAANYRRVREESGADPIDLSGALDGLQEPVYFDSAHTNELGAKTVAKAMYKYMLPLLKASDAN